jgi:hypothetical protein
MILIYTLLFQGCSADRSDKVHKLDALQVAGKIQESKLTNSEKELIQGLDVDKCFIFDTDIKSENILQVEFWVDYYEKGTFKSMYGGIESDIQSQKDKNKNVRLIFSTQKFSANNFEDKWIFSILSEGSAGKGSISTKTPDKLQVQTWSNIKESEIIIGNEIVLAVITGTERDMVSGISVEELNVKDEIIKNQAIKELLQNDYVYILKCRFK